MKYITGHAQQFGVQTESYALIGYSSGGHLAGLFASDALGYKNYGLPKPGAVILRIPSCSFPRSHRSTVWASTLCVRPVLL